MALLGDARLVLGLLGTYNHLVGQGVYLPLRALDALHMGQLQARMACHAKLSSTACQM